MSYRDKEEQKSYLKFYGKMYRAAHKEQESLRHKIYAAKNSEKIKVYHKELGQIFKRKVLDYYGHKCSCYGCGITEDKFLTVDHIAGGGAKHRKEIKGSLYRWLLLNNFPPGFQTLCMNCNFAKGKYGYCPHMDLVVIR